MHHNSNPYDECAIFLNSCDALCEKQTEIKSLIIFSASEALKSHLHSLHNVFGSLWTIRE